MLASLHKRDNMAKEREQVKYRLMAYKKPEPGMGEKTRFKPGQSGNPNGVPKGTKHINTWVQELLSDEKFEAQIQQGYKVVDFKGAPIKAIVQAQMIKALQGDTAAYKVLIDSGWAKKSEVENSGEQKLIIETRKHGDTND